MAPLYRLTRSTMQGPRLLLRPFRLADAPALFDCIESCRAKIRNNVPWSVQVRTVGQMRRRIRGIFTEHRRREMKRCVMVERATGEVIGTVMLGLGRLRSEGNAMIGYWMRADRWGRGYATESTILLARFAVERLDAATVDLWIDPNNKRSRRIPERLGIPFAGRDNYWWEDAGKWVRSVIYKATAKEIRALRTPWNAKLREYATRTSGE